MFSQSSVYAEQLLHTEALTQRGLFTEKLLRTEVFTRKLYTEKLSHREASKQSILYTQKHLHAQKLYIHTERLHADGCTHRSLFTELTDRRFDAERPLHRAAFAHRGFYAQKFLHISFTQTSFYTQKPLHRIFDTQKHVHTHKSFLHTLAQKHLIELLMWNASNVQKHSS